MKKRVLLAAFMFMSSWAAIDPKWDFSNEVGSALDGHLTDISYTNYGALNLTFKEPSEQSAWAQIVDIKRNIQISSQSSQEKIEASEEQLELLSKSLGKMDYVLSITPNNAEKTIEIYLKSDYFSYRSSRGRSESTYKDFFTLFLRKDMPYQIIFKAITTSMLDSFVFWNGSKQPENRRVWKRTEKGWVEHHPDGRSVHFKLRDEFRLFDVLGGKLYRNEEDRKMLIFIPNYVLTSGLLGSNSGLENLSKIGRVEQLPVGSDK